MAIKKTLTDFAEHTTIHGIGYIFDGLIPRFERFIWFLIFGFFGTLAMYWTGTDYQLWQGNPVLTSIKSTGTMYYIHTYLLLMKLKYIPRRVVFFIPGDDP